MTLVTHEVTHPTKPFSTLPARTKGVAGESTQAALLAIADWNNGGGGGGGSTYDFGTTGVSIDHTFYVSNMGSSDAHMTDGMTLRSEDAESAASVARGRSHHAVSLQPRGGEPMLPVEPRASVRCDADDQRLRAAVQQTMADLAGDLPLCQVPRGDRPARRLHRMGNDLTQRQVAGLIVAVEHPPLLLELLADEYEVRPVLIAGDFAPVT